MIMVIWEMVEYIFQDCIMNIFTYLPSTMCVGSEYLSLNVFCVIADEFKYYYSIIHEHYPRQLYSLTIPDST